MLVMALQAKNCGARRQKPQSRATPQGESQYSSLWRKVPQLARTSTHLLLLQPLGSASRQAVKLLAPLHQRLNLTTL
jgi:hypothetical protein